jgi:hypothetical protein
MRAQMLRLSPHRGNLRIVERFSFDLPRRRQKKNADGPMLQGFRQGRVNLSRGRQNDWNALSQCPTFVENG